MSRPEKPGDREAGVRHLFTVRRLRAEPTHHAALYETLLAWCRTFDREGLAPLVGGASAGNLSVRTPDGFTITPTRCRLKAGLPWQELVEVVEVDRAGFVLGVRGRNVPSSDSFLHAEIYQRRADVRAVFHGHDDLILQRARELAAELPVIPGRRERAFGTLEDARETADELGDGSCVIRPGHGFVTAGSTPEEAGHLSLRLHNRARELAGGT